MPAPAAVIGIAKGIGSFVGGFQTTALPTSEWTREELAAVNEPTLTSIERRVLRTLISGTGPARGGTNAIFVSGVMNPGSSIWAKIAKYAPPQTIEAPLAIPATVQTREARADTVPIPRAIEAQRAAEAASASFSEPSRGVDPLWVAAGAGLLAVLLILRR